MTAKGKGPLKVNVLTLFPEMIETSFSYSILKRAKSKGLVDPRVINIRDYTKDKHRCADDKPYGGGAGMVMKIEPVARALADLKKQKRAGKVYLLSPTGKVFDHQQAQRLAKERKFTLLCGHYEGLDQRIHDHLVDDEISIGDFVLTGGEPAAVVIVDAVTRLLPDVLGDDNSALFDSFADGLLDHPHYTRPLSYKRWKVPDVLLTGHHKNVTAWRRKQQLIRTLQKRPDLIEKADLSREDEEILQFLKNTQAFKRDKRRRKQ